MRTSISAILAVMISGAVCARLQGQDPLPQGNTSPPPPQGKMIVPPGIRNNSSPGSASDKFLPLRLRLLHDLIPTQTQQETEENRPPFELTPGGTRDVPEPIGGSPTTLHEADAIQQAWVAHYGVGLTASDDQAYAMAVDHRDRSIYVVGATGLAASYDYAIVKYDSEGIQQWAARYDGPGHLEDRATAVALDLSGNVYVTGYSAAGPGEAYDYATIKYDVSGVQQWVARYNGPASSYDAATAIAVDAAGNVYVTGRSDSLGGYPDYTTIKYNSSGVQLWVSRYHGPSHGVSYPTSLAVDPSGNVYVTGYSWGWTLRYDYATVKYDSSGVQQWASRYDGPGNSDDHATALAVDASGNVYVTGYSTGSGTAYDYATIKYDSSGVQEWITRYNGPGNGNDWATALAVDGSGNVYVTGDSRGSGTSADFATIKYNGRGVAQWVERYNGPGNLVDGAGAIAVDAWGNVYVTGNSDGLGSSRDYATVKYDSSGAQQWAARYNGVGNSDDYPYALAVDGSGNSYVTGFSGGSGTFYDFATIKYDNSGAQRWIARYNRLATSNDFANSIAVDGLGNVYVTGPATDSGSTTDYATIKYNSRGVQQWVARYDGPGNGTDVAISLAVDGSGNVYVTGHSVGSSTLSDYATIKYNSLGVQQWVARYSGAGGSNNYPSAVALDVSGNVYVTGGSYGPGVNSDYATIKYDRSGVQQWAVRYNGPQDSYDVAYAMTIDASGNVYVTGTSYGSGTAYDYATVKYDSSGVQQWAARYNGPGNGDDVAYAIGVDQMGDVCVTGYSAGEGTLSDYATVKYDNSGIQEWATRYNGPGNADDYAYAISVATSGSVYVTGFSGGLGTSTDYATIKYGKSGAQQWVARYDGPADSSDYATAVAIDAWENVFVTGRSVGQGTSSDFATIKYDSSGAQEWVARYNGTDNTADYASALAVDKSENVYVTGGSMRGIASIFTTVKYGAAFALSSNELSFEATSITCEHQMSVSVTDAGAGDLIISSVISDDADFTVSPSSASIRSGDSVQFNVVFSPLSAGAKSGNIIFTHNLPGSHDTLKVFGMGVGTGSAVSIIRVYGSGWQLVSQPLSTICPVIAHALEYDLEYQSTDTLRFGKGYWEKLTDPEIAYVGFPVATETLSVEPKWNLIGSISWPVAVKEIRCKPPRMKTSAFFGYDGSGYYTADTIFPGRGYWVRVRKAGELVLDTSKHSRPGESDRIKIIPDGETPPPPPDRVVNSADAPSGLPRTYALSQNYPNPFNPSTIFTYQVPARGRVTLRIYNLLGQEIATLVDGFQEAGYKSVAWNSGGIASGVYLYCLTAGNFVQTRKLVLLK